MERSTCTAEPGFAHPAIVAAGPEPATSADADYLARLEKEVGYYPVHELSCLEAELTARKYLVPAIKGRSVLEMGCGVLNMTGYFLEAAAHLDVVDGAESFARQAAELLGTSPSGGEAFHSLFENFTPTRRYQSIVLANTLHHLHDPSALLRRMTREWLLPDGELVMVVQNVLSLHRRLGVKLGLLENEYSATEMNEQYCQPGRYSADSLQELLRESGFEVREMFGFYLKPFNLERMYKLSLSEREVEALFEIGREYEDMANLIFVRAACQETPRN